MIHIAHIESDSRSRFTFKQIGVLLRARGIDNQMWLYDSPGEAIDSITHERPDIVFVDLRTYDGGAHAGLDLVRMLRQHPLCSNTIIVGMAEYAMPADRASALAAGCHAFMPKPIRYQAVEEAITQLVIEPTH